ncbi:MAG: nitric-oxide reductase large subunit [Betaproteobacteria bacterium]|nr:nitric-oxide reductase large subunit [Betaproteobacteria bacterium]
MFTMRRLWLMFAALMTVMFSALLAVGGRLYQEAPPVPKAVMRGDAVFFTEKSINDGRDVWRQLGGMQLGSVWGHGGYLAPDWTADALHREAVEILSARGGGDIETLDAVKRARLIAEFGEEIHKNTYDSETGNLHVSEERAAAMERVFAHYQKLFSEDSAEFESLREKYAIPNSPASGDLTAEQVRNLGAFFWWTAWAAVTHRPGDSVSYTNNWPHEPLVGNTPTASAFLWTFISVVLLILGIGLLCWFFNRMRDSWQVDKEPEEGYPAENPLDSFRPTTSMRAVGKYIWLVIILIGAQILLGATTAHYAVEGHDFYGFPLSDYFPYALTRTWHTQLAVLWIATSWLGAGLYAAPLIAGFEPPKQHWGVNFLFAALFIAIVGAMVGQYAAVHGAFLDSPNLNFWFGHQGYEYIDMGRFWQSLIFAGLLIWVFLMLRGMLPAIRRRGADYHLLLLLAASSAAIGLLYGAGLLYGKDTHLTIAEYWRWWVVHLWVEGVFEVFAAAWIAWIFVRMRLLNPHTAAVYVMFSAMIFLGGGVLGTFHHLYFQGTPESVLALGAVFSALEVVPLALIAFEAHDHWLVEKDAPWVRAYHMPLMFFFAVAFWNLLGAGVLGFLINPPLALYYLQGLQTTPAHAHAALFGVYGLLGIGLLLFCLRGLTPKTADWRDGMLRAVFWLFNGGLALMVFASILPQGLLQAHESFSRGYWHARTAEFMHSEWMETLVWIRVPGDIVFSLGALLLLIFVAKAYFPRSR